MTIRSVYAPPTADLGEAPELIHLSEAERLRTEHIDHEAAIRSVGVLYLVTGAILLAPIVSLPLAVNADPDAALDFVAGGLIMAAMSALYVGLGLGIRRLAIWTRIPTCLLSLLGLLAFPLGTLLGAYILYLFLSEKGRFVLTERYAAVVSLTPHIKRRTSIVVKIAIALLGLGVLALALTLVLG